MRSVDTMIPLMKCVRRFYSCTREADAALRLRPMYVCRVPLAVLKVPIYTKATAVSPLTQVAA